MKKYSHLCWWQVHKASKKDVHLSYHFVNLSTDLYIILFNISRGFLISANWPKSMLMQVLFFVFKFIIQRNLWQEKNTHGMQHFLIVIAIGKLVYLPLGSLVFKLLLSQLPPNCKQCPLQVFGARNLRRGGRGCGSQRPWSREAQGRKSWRQQQQEVCTFAIFHLWPMTHSIYSICEQTNTAKNNVSKYV